ncbi:MAG: Rpn family recombination-promoting nuclease/putative transposase [Candidatus Lariskella arthropodorum]
MSNDVNPRVDIAFKKLFGVEENKDLLMSLINAIVSKEDQVADIELLNPYNPRNFRNDKLSVLDIKARGNTGRRYNIEIQISDEADYDKRALYYWAKLYTEQLQKGADYSSLNKAIGIHILNFLSIPGVEKYHNVFHLREKENGFHYFDDMELHTIELNKFDITNAELKEFLPKIKTSLDKWVMFLSRYDLLAKDKLPKELDDPSLEKAIDVLEEMNFSKAERDAYEAHRKWLMIEANTLKKAQADSFAEGLEKGKIEGQLAEKMKIAKNLLLQGLDIDMIEHATGLSRTAILKLQKDEKNRD